eukprot:CAMPEP_0173114442 /NCGR_PEP_ID=MMETSP1102-20130122/47660_1 /TAXON_ID=49646 /ORGANISM="Geminigera sp., Strain Caron Lab Isolate" /LENGTH=56 /DNA_ID=CAMNT_0014016793 /DNA_START=585 /DNA_END=752 /DNA_ORIENTATION=+
MDMSSMLCNVALVALGPVFGERKFQLLKSFMYDIPGAVVIVMPSSLPLTPPPSLPN